MYTRNGTLHLSPSGDLLGPEDRAILDPQGKPIKLDPSQAITITGSGEVRQQSATVAQLAIVEFPNASALSKMGQSYFQAPSSASPIAAKETEVKQGAVESSNAVPSDAAVRLVSVLRLFEMLQKTISVGTEMNRRAMEDVANFTS
jgi:flagellar basal body rod protein FlgG